MEGVEGVEEVKESSSDGGGGGSVVDDFKVVYEFGEGSKGLLSATVYCGREGGRTWRTAFMKQKFPLLTRPGMFDWEGEAGVRESEECHNRGLNAADKTEETAPPVREDESLSDRASASP